MGKAEAKIQNDIMVMLMDHPAVAHAHVTTNGTFKVKGYWLTVGFEGQSDIIGQMRDGRYLAIEVKQPGEKPTKEQLDFIETVLRNNGVAGWASSAGGAMSILDSCDGLS